MAGETEIAAEVVSEQTATAPQLKPIHIIVMVITLLHAVAIGVWFMVFLAGTKGSSRDRPQPPPRPDAAAPTAAASAEPEESKKTQ